MFSAPSRSKNCLAVDFVTVPFWLTDHCVAGSGSLTAFTAVIFNQPYQRALLAHSYSQPRPQGPPREKLPTPVRARRTRTDWVQGAQAHIFRCFPNLSVGNAGSGLLLWNFSIWTKRVVGFEDKCFYVMGKKNKQSVGKSIIKDRAKAGKSPHGTDGWVSESDCRWLETICTVFNTCISCSKFPSPSVESNDYPTSNNIEGQC